DCDGRCGLRAQGGEFVEELAAGLALDAVIQEVTAEIGLEEIPAPGGNHCGASVSWAAECRTSSWRACFMRWRRSSRSGTRASSASEPTSGRPRCWSP